MLAWLCVWVKVQIWIWPSWCHCHSQSLAPVNYPDWFYLSGAGLLRMQQCPWTQWLSASKIGKNVYWVNITAAVQTYATVQVQQQYTLFVLLESLPLFIKFASYFMVYNMQAHDQNIMTGYFYFTTISSHNVLSKQMKELTSLLTRLGSFFVSGTFVCPGITRTLNSSSTFQQISHFLLPLPDQ